MNVKPDVRSYSHHARCTYGRISNTLRIHYEIFVEDCAELAAFVLALLILAPALSAGPDVTTTVEVRTAGGDLVTQSYVALVPLWRPWSKPSAEGVAEKGISTFGVVAGTYHVIAGARGFEVSVRESVKITTPAGTKVAIVLTPLQPVTGTVRDTDLRAIPGARVATVHGAILPTLGKLSALAVRHLGSDWVATTDRRGHWRLAVPEGAVPLFFEASGYAGEWQVRSAGAAELDVKLVRGAELTITTDRVDLDLIVSLSPESGVSQNAVLATEQERLWARWAASGVLSWKSLPPGTYDILAKYPAPRYFNPTASKLATVRLEPGGVQKLRLLLPPARKPATSTSALFLWQIWRSDLTELKAFGRSASGDPRLLEHFLEEVVGGTVVHLRTGDVRPPFYATTSDWFFSLVQDLPDEHREPSVEPWWALAHPRADAHFSVRFLEEELQPPRTGIVVLTGCKNVRRVRTLMEIKGNVGEFMAPAGCESLILELPPFEPVIAARSLLPGDQSLGEYVLRAAGSADVRVARDPGGAIAAGATVRAVSAEIPGERSTVIKEAVTDDRGWAHLTGLPSYWNMRISAETIDGDKSPGTELRVSPRQRAVVDPLLVPMPAALIVDARTDPAFLARFPATRLLTLTVRPADPERESEARQENLINVAPPYRFDKLHPGRWLVSAVVSVAGTYALVDLDDVELKAGDERRVEPTVVPNVFDGTVTSKGEGVGAKVMVEDHDRTLNFNTSATGEFRVVLQKKGVYPVAVARLSAQGNIIPIGQVSFTDPTRSVEILLPDGGFATVRVIRGNRRVPNSSVWMSRRRESGVVEAISSRAAKTDATGEATFEDLPAGLWTFTVREAGEREGAEKTVQVESGKRAVVELQLTDTAALHGTIVELGGPVPRARVDCVFTGASGNPDRAFTDTDTEGAFEIELIPPFPREALCSVVGPMGTVDAFRAIPGRSLSLSLPASTAAVRFPEWPLYSDREALWLVAPDGRAVSLGTVATKIGRFGAPLDIPALAAGSWKVVRVLSRADRLALASGMAASLSGLAEIALRANARETIHLRDASAARSSGVTFHP